MKKLFAAILTLCLCIGLLAGCGNGSKSDSPTKAAGNTKAADQDGEAQGSSGDKKVMVIGDTTFNASNEEPDVNPHNAYAGWACIRYAPIMHAQKPWRRGDIL